MPLQATSGAASYDGFGGGVPFEPTYIEQVFATHLYTGNGSTQTITNGIDLSTKGGLVWMKARSSALSNFLCDTARGRAYYLYSDWNGAQQGPSASNRDLTSFNTDGFSLGQNANADINTNAVTFASWTFREQPKFFDIVTYTGNGANRTIAHSLGSVPGCIIVKRTDTTGAWAVYHRSLANTEYMVLNTTAAKATGATYWNSTTATSTDFSLGTATDVNANTGTYVAYLFAHDAGGFGLTGTDNVISCGSATCDSGGTATVNLGYEPQWVLFKSSSAASDWRMLDNMRGWTNNSTGNQPGLLANSSAAETTYGWTDTLSPTGFTIWGSSSQQFIYIAIRRGPMKTPTTGTSVYNAIARTGTGANATITGVGFPPDLVIAKRRNAGDSTPWVDRLRGRQTVIRSDDAGAEFTGTGAAIWDLLQNGFSVGTSSESNGSGSTYVNWAMRRAPGFFDVVCYTGTGGFRAVPHNLGVAPELIITKSRNGAGNWWTAANITANNWRLLAVDDPGGGTVYTYSSELSSQPTATDLYFWGGFFNSSATTYVAYLFASCPGVSKVGTYTGNGSSQTINCGFTGGARFVLIKRTNASGDWVVFDSARGIVSGNDPFLELNTLDAEDTGQDAVDTDSTGFVVNETSRSLNASGGTYIFLAIA